FGEVYSILSALVRNRYSSSITNIPKPHPSCHTTNSRLSFDPAIRTLFPGASEP
uniref:Uncharacterized protein n=1 Tax=Anopheles albimanus TaxID=7167 RepID=A0A182FWY4_ANOAL